MRLHIQNGDCAAGSFKQAFLLPKEEILVFRDVLSCGHLPVFNGLDSWVKYRRDYWSKMYAEHGFGSVEEVEKAPHDFYNDFDELKKADEVSLWMGCALSDHLLMVFMVKLFDHYGLDFSKLTIRQYLKIEKGNITIVGLGMLHPDQIEALKPEAFTLNEEQIAFCLNVWEAVTAKTPDALLQILKQQDSSLSLLNKALQNFLYRYPDSKNGLSRFDEIILNAAKKSAPNTARIIGYSLGYDMHLDDEDNIHALDTVGDIYLFNRLKNMAKSHLNKPLLSLNVMNESLRETKTEITEFGLKVLEGKHNVVQVNGINDWVGGVHLNASIGETWFRQDNELILKNIERS